MKPRLIEHPILSELAVDVNPYKTYGFQQYVFNPWETRRKVWIEKQSCGVLNNYFLKLPFLSFYSYKVFSIKYMTLTFDTSVSNHLTSNNFNVKKFRKNLHTRYELYKYFWFCIKLIISKKICSSNHVIFAHECVNALTPINHENLQNALHTNQINEASSVLSSCIKKHGAYYRFIYMSGVLVY
jgi:hypothetical protein